MGTPEVEALKAALVCNNRWAGYCTIAVFAGLLVEYTVLLWFKRKDLCWSEILITVSAGIAIAGGVYGEYLFGSRASAAALKLESISENRIADSEGEAAGLKKDAEKLNQRNLVLQVEVLRLRKEAEPRRLTGKQRELLVNVLAGHPTPIAVVSCIVDSESKDFADDFVSAFEAAHWKVFRITNRISSKYGVSIGMVYGNPIALPEVKLLSDALTRIKVPHNIVSFSEGDASTSPAFQAHVLYLVVEHKPPLESPPPAK